MEIHLPTSIRDLTDLISVSSGIFTILGFSVVGVYVVIKRILLLLIRSLVRRSDRRKLGPEYNKLVKLMERDPSFDRKSPRSIAKHTKRVGDELRQLITECLAARNAASEALHASGSTRLRYRDILTRDGLLMPLSFQDERTKEILSIGLLVDDIKRQRSEAEDISRARYLIIGDAGTGKSLSGIFVEATINTQSVSGVSWVFSLRAEDFLRGSHQEVQSLVGREDFGSLAWCAEILAKRIGLAQPSELQRYQLMRILEYDALITLDGLDEIVQRLGRCEGERLISSWLFRKADIIWCRTVFYYTFLLGTAAISDVRVVSIQMPDMVDRTRFLNAACLAIHGENSAPALATIERGLREQPAIASLVQTPLLLMMLVEITEDSAALQIVNDSVSVYSAFLTKILRRDSSRVGFLWPEGIVSAILSDLAWTVFVVSRSVRRGIDRIDRVAVRDAIHRHIPTITQADLSALEEGILELPIFHTSRELSSPYHYTVYFSHESFGEFLVALKLYQWLLDKSQGGEEFFDVIETPGISYFIKNYIARLRLSEKDQAIAAQRLDDLLTCQLRKATGAPSEIAGRIGTFSAGQVAYYFGMLANATQRKVLEKLADSHEEFWIKRAAAIGLAFGGDAKALDRLINSMWSDMEAGDFSTARKNMAIELGFYGDQEFDCLDPTRDTGCTKCERMMTQIARQLDSFIESPNWRMDMFDVLYLAKHRPESRGDFDRVCGALRPRFLVWLKSAKLNPRLNCYREVGELDLLLCKEG